MEKCDATMKLLRRKIDRFLEQWKADANHKPLIVRGARQIGKTESIRQFARTHYANVVEINFVFQKQYKQIFSDGYEVDQIIKNISLEKEMKELFGDIIK